MRRIIPILVAALGLTTQAYAAPPHLYEIQVLVFANHLRKLDGQEQWGQEKISRITGFKKALSPNDSLPLGSQLAIAQSILARHTHYTILAAASWVQNLVSLRTTKPIRIENDTNGKLKGVIRVFQWRLMHITLDLHYTPTASVLSTGPATTYQLIASRPMALRQTNYFDHPKLGVLVRIVPYTGPVSP